MKEKEDSTTHTVDDQIWSGWFWFVVAQPSPSMKTDKDNRDMENKDGNLGIYVKHQCQVLNVACSATQCLAMEGFWM